VLAAYDGSEHSLAGTRHAATLATQMGRELVILHVATDGDEPGPPETQDQRELLALGRRALAAAEARGVELCVERARAEGGTVEAITRAAHRHDAALIVAGTRGRGPLSAALLGSVSAGLVRSAERAVVLASAR
jgi:nucleotide-binding universal stress UspA family protein